MKKIISVVAITLALFFMSGCGNTEEHSSANAPATIVPTSFWITREEVYQKWNPETRSFEEASKLYSDGSTQTELVDGKLWRVFYTNYSETEVSSSVCDLMWMNARLYANCPGTPNVHSNSGDSPIIRFEGDYVFYNLIEEAKYLAQLIEEGKTLPNEMLFQGKTSVSLCSNNAKDACVYIFEKVELNGLYYYNYTVYKNDTNWKHWESNQEVVSAEILDALNSRPLPNIHVLSVSVNEEGEYPFFIEEQN